MPNILTISDTDCDQVRLLISNKITPTDLSNDQIRSDILLGEASDYVYGEVSENVITNAINTFFLALPVAQQTRFKRAVLNRVAGLAIDIVREEVRVNEGEFTEEYTTSQFTYNDLERLQQKLFVSADRQIKRLIEVNTTLNRGKSADWNLMRIA